MKIDKNYAPTMLRIGVGLVFLVAGLTKLLLMKPAGTAGMLSGMGFPAAMFLAWLLIVVEVVGGIMMLAGYRLRLAIVPLGIVMIGAIVFGTIPMGLQDPINWGFTATNLLIIAALKSLWLTGPGKYSAD